MAVVGTIGTIAVFDDFNFRRGNFADKAIPLPVVCAEQAGRFAGFAVATVFFKTESEISGDVMLNSVCSFDWLSEHAAMSVGDKSAFRARWISCR